MQSKSDACQEILCHTGEKQQQVDLVLVHSAAYCSYKSGFGDRGKQLTK